MVIIVRVHSKTELQKKKGVLRCVSTKLHADGHDCNSGPNRLKILFPKQPSGHPDTVTGKTLLETHPTVVQAELILYLQTQMTFVDCPRPGEHTLIWRGIDSVVGLNFDTNAHIILEMEI